MTSGALYHLVTTCLVNYFIILVFVSLSFYPLFYFKNCTFENYLLLSVLLFYIYSELVNGLIFDEDY